MKTFVAIALALTGITAQATIIHDARVEGKNLIVDLTYGGGCKEHTFSLDLQGCAESFPAQCVAKLVDNTTGDFCEALVSKTVTINLAQNGIKGSYYSEASLKIYSDMNGNDRHDKNDQGMMAETSALVDLPKMKDSDDSGIPSSGKLSSLVACTTHTGSNLKIYAEDSVVHLTTTAGETHSYKITARNYLFLESYPPQLETRYSLNDGRSIVTRFVDQRITGRGYFVRTDGSTSPEFSCQRNIVNDVE